MARQTRSSARRSQLPTYLIETCEECGARFGSQQEVWNHAKSTHVNGKHECQFCLARFKSRDQRQQHITRSHPEHDANMIKQVDNIKTKVESTEATESAVTKPATNTKLFFNIKPQFPYLDRQKPLRPYRRPYQRMALSRFMVPYAVPSPKRKPPPRRIAPVTMAKTKENQTEPKEIVELPLPETPKVTTTFTSQRSLLQPDPSSSKNYGCKRQSTSQQTNICKRTSGPSQTKVPNGSTSSLLNHTQTSTPRSTLCKKQKQLFREGDSFPVETLVHNGVTYIICPWCGELTASAEKFQEHINAHQDQSVSTQLTNPKPGPIKSIEVINLESDDDEDDQSDTGASQIQKVEPQKPPPPPRNFFYACRACGHQTPCVNKIRLHHRAEHAQLPIDKTLCKIFYKTKSENNCKPLQTQPNGSLSLNNNNGANEKTEIEVIDLD